MQAVHQVHNHDSPLLPRLPPNQSKSAWARDLVASLQIGSHGVHQHAQARGPQLRRQVDEGGARALANAVEVVLEQVAHLAQHGGQLGAHQLVGQKLEDFYNCQGHGGANFVVLPHQVLALQMNTATDGRRSR